MCCLRNDVCKWLDFLDNDRNIVIGIIHASIYLSFIWLAGRFGLSVSKLIGVPIFLSLCRSVCIPVCVFLAIYFFYFVLSSYCSFSISPCGFYLRVGLVGPAFSRFLQFFVFRVSCFIIIGFSIIFDSHIFSHYTKSLLYFQHMIDKLITIFFGTQRLMNKYGTILPKTFWNMICL